MNKLCLILFLFLLPIKSSQKTFQLTQDYKPQGIDVSYHQKNIKWSKVSDVDFVFIKATEGISIRDPKFQYNWSSSKKRGILRGAYHFYRPYVSADAQFRHFASCVRLEVGDLPPVLDAEISSHNPTKLKKDFKRWLLLVESHYGIRPIIYCNSGFYKKYFRDDFFKKYQFWIANYVTKDVSKTHKDWYFWQYTSQGKVRGINSYVDKNVFNGSYNSLLKLCKK